MRTGLSAPKRAGATDAALPAGAPLDEAFFARPPRRVARELIGCLVLCDGVGGRIVETEAYEQDDPACHAFIGRTSRTDVLFGPPGRAYVYLCYGIHRMLNFVCDAEGIAAAVLIRALEPTHGIDAMRARRPAARGARDLCSGPGKLCEALAIGLELNRAGLSEPPFELSGAAPGAVPEVVAGPRIGITKAADLPWRYCLAGSPFASAPAG